MTDFVEFPKIARYSREVIVTEKIDGSNAQVFVVDNTMTPDERVAVPTGISPIPALGGDVWLYAGSRNRWITRTLDNFNFFRWVEANADELAMLGPGRHYGEWWGSGIQRGYGLQKGEKRFSLFNVARWADERPSCCSVVPVLWRGTLDNFDIVTAMETLRLYGSQAAPGFMNPEGIVIFHPQGNVAFKKTYEKDDAGKGREPVAAELTRAA
jgi:hypothetical protein